MSFLLDDALNEVSFGSEDYNNDIDEFITDLVSKKDSNNQVNIVKMESKQKSNAPIEVTKAVNTTKETKNDLFPEDNFIPEDTLDKKSNCEFSDSDIDFADFMFSDDEVKKEKKDGNKQNKVENKNNNPINQEPKKVESNANNTIKNEKIPEKPNNTATESNNLDEFCLNDDKQDDLDKEAFEISDISIPDTNQIKPTKKEIKIENPKQDKNEKKGIDVNELFDTNKKESKEKEEIEIPKVQPKKTVKKKRKPARNQANPSPLNILDNLDLGFSFEENKTQDIDDIFDIKPKTNENKKINLPINKYNNTEKIKVEKVTNDSNPIFERTNLPPLQTKSLPLPQEVVLKPGLEAFEYSFVNNLTYFLSEFRFSFINQLQNQLRKSFDYDAQINAFLNSFTRELNEIIKNASYYQNAAPLPFPDIENEINSEFNQYLSLFPNSSSAKPESDQFILENQISIDPIEKVELLNSKFSSECKNILRQISNESQQLNDNYQEISRSQNFSKTIEISELESKLIQISTERDFIESRLSYVKERHMQARDDFDFFNASDDDNRKSSKSSQIEYIIEKLKTGGLQKARTSQHAAVRSLAGEICGLCSQLSFQSLQKPLFQSNNENKPFNNAYYQAEAGSAPALGFSFDSVRASPSSGIIEEIRNRLNQVRRMREETIEDLRRCEPSYNFSLSGF